MSQFHVTLFIVRPFSGPDFRRKQSSFHSQNDIIPPSPPLELIVTEDDLTAETSLTIKDFTWNWLITYPTSQLDGIF